MSITVDTPQIETSNRPLLVDTQQYIHQVQNDYAGRDQIAPIWYLILAGEHFERTSIMDRDSHDLAKYITGHAAEHPQTRRAFQNMEYDDSRILTRQELDQPLEQRIAFFTWRNPTTVGRLEAEVGDTYKGVLAQDRTFVQAMMADIHHRGHLTVRQLDALQTHWATADAAPVTPEAPTGRVTVTGTLQSTRTEHTRYGAVTKMLVKADEGFTVWGTMPKGLHAKGGDHIEFTATLKPANDPTHAFFSRPAKAQQLND